MKKEVGEVEQEEVVVEEELGSERVWCYLSRLESTTGVPRGWKLGTVQVREERHVVERVQQDRARDREQGVEGGRQVGTMGELHWFRVPEARRGLATHRGERQERSR